MTTTQNEVDRLLDVHFYESHADSDTMTCLSLYLKSPDLAHKVYIYNASPEQKATWFKQECDCGVELNRKQFKTAITKLIEKAALEARIDELEELEKYRTDARELIRERIEELKSQLQDLDKTNKQ